MSYVRQNTWLENGPRRAGRPGGLGDTSTCPAGQAMSPSGGVCVPVVTDSVSVFGCSPDICMFFDFPWVGRRADNPGGASLPCVCQPVLAIPSPWGTVITVGILGLLGFKVLKGVAG